MTSADYRTVERAMVAGNRPTNAQNLFVGLGKAVNKPIIEKIFTELSNPTDPNSKFVRKENGKQIIYWPRQPETGIDPKELKQLDQDIANADEEARQLSLTCNTLNSRLKRALVEPNDETLDKEIGVLTASVAEKRDRIKNLQNIDIKVSNKDKANLDKVYKKMVQTWRKRKRMADDIIGGIMEGGYPKKKKNLIQETQVETDEEAGISIKDFL